MGKPGFEVGDDRSGAFLSRRAAGRGIMAPDLSLNAIEVADTLHALFGNRRRAGAGDLSQHRTPDIPTLRALFGPSEDTLPTVKVQLADLKSYGRLASTQASDLEVTA